MTTPDDRIDELMAAAVAGELTPSESDELDRLRLAHSWIDEELRSLRAVRARLRASELTWTQPTQIDALRERVLSEIPTVTRREHRMPDAGSRAASNGAVRRRWVASLVAAACLVIGLTVGAGMPALLSLPPSGPPGTLGAIELVDVTESAVGVDVDAELVAHTWGTEAVLDATGLSVGETYTVVLVGADGTEFSAGQILGSEVPIHCRVNAAVLRADAVRLEIRDAESHPVALADLPEV